jgi:hypothetical protein
MKILISMKIDRIPMNSVVTKIITLASVFLLPLAVGASGLIDPNLNGTDNEFANLIANVLSFINDYLVPFVIGLAFLVFVWGVFKYFVLGGSDEEKQSEGKSLIIYAVIGFVLILSVYGIIELVADGLGFSGDETIITPTVPDNI